MCVIHVREPHALSAEMKGQGTDPPSAADPTVLGSCTTGGTRGGGGGFRDVVRYREVGTVEEGLRGTAKGFFFFFHRLSSYKYKEANCASIPVQHTCSRQRFCPYISLLKSTESSDSWGAERKVRGAWVCVVMSQGCCVAVEPRARFSVAAPLPGAELMAAHPLARGRNGEAVGRG